MLIDIPGVIKEQKQMGDASLVVYTRDNGKIVLSIRYKDKFYIEKTFQNNLDGLDSLAKERKVQKEMKN
jgi:hypothetical protein